MARAAYRRDVRRFARRGLGTGAAIRALEEAKESLLATTAERFCWKNASPSIFVHQQSPSVIDATQELSHARPPKAETNFAKHGVCFERAAEVFRDPLALTIPDEEHSVGEFRWITLGKDERSQYVLVIHTFDQTGETSARVRMISARRPSKSEIHEYEEQ